MFWKGIGPSSPRWIGGDPSAEDSPHNIQMGNRKSRTRRCSLGPIRRRSTITASLLRWYRRNSRDLPWRGERDPYRILVSEVMLQQTQVGRVLAKYPLFLSRFPSFQKLARAKSSSVIKAWQGMGYNGRAVRLWRLARTLMLDGGGKLPGDTRALQKLPGIGLYTASALACFTFGKQVAVVDTNVSRVLYRLFPASVRRRTLSRNETIRRGDLWDAAASLLPKGRAKQWNQALMDLGSTICTARAPKCGACPVQAHCPSAHQINRTRADQRKREPAREGIPNRIYRGRIVEALRNLNGTSSIGQHQLAVSIKPNYRRGDRKWFRQILVDLERDGLVRLARTTTGLRVSLPD